MPSFGTDDAAVEQIKHYESLFSEQVPVRAIWQEIIDYMMPGKRTMWQRGTPIRGTEKLFDSTAIDAAQLLASSIHGSVFSPSTIWAYLRAEDDRINDDRDASLWLEDSTRRMHWAFQQSNLNAEIGECLLDFSTFATGSLYLDEVDPASERFSGFHFKATPLGDFVIGEDTNGVANSYYRLIELPVGAVVSRWKATVDQSVTAKAEGDKFQKHRVLFACYPRENGRTGGFATRMPFAHMVIDYDNKRRLEEGGYEEFPYFVPRWSKASGETYGRGPGWYALPDVKSLNLAKMRELQAWELSLLPPTKRTETGVIGRVRLTPGGETLVRTMDDLQPLTTVKADWRASQIKSEELVGKIQKMFFWDQLKLVEHDRMTATEVEQRVAIMQRILGPVLGRMDSELAKPLVQRAFLILYRKRALLPPPEVLRNYIASGGAIQIRYQGPLARAQQQSEVQAIQRVLGVLGPLEQVMPGILDNVDGDGVAEVVIEQSGASTKIRKDPRVRDAERQHKLQVMQEQKQLDQAQQMAQTAGHAAPMVKALAPQGNGNAPE